MGELGPRAAARRRPRRAAALGGDARDRGRGRASHCESSSSSDSQKGIVIGKGGRGAEGGGHAVRQQLPDGGGYLELFWCGSTRTGSADPRPWSGWATRDTHTSRTALGDIQAVHGSACDDGSTVVRPRSRLRRVHRGFFVERAFNGTSLNIIKHPVPGVPWPFAQQQQHRAALSYTLATIVGDHEDLFKVRVASHSSGAVVGRRFVLVVGRDQRHAAAPQGDPGGTTSSSAISGMPTFRGTASSACRSTSASFE